MFADIIMVSRREMQAVHRIASIIKKTSPLSNVQLQLKCEISLSHFGKLRPILIELYDGKIEYQFKEKVWKWIEPAPVDESEVKDNKTN